MFEFHAMFVCWLICPQQRSLASGRPVCLVMCMDAGAAPSEFWKPIKRALSQLMGFNEKIHLEQTLPARPMLSYFLLILQSASRSDGSGTVISHVFDYAHFHHVKSFNKKYCICHFYLFFYVFLSVAVLGRLPDSFIKTEISFVYSLFPKIIFICRCWLCLSVVGVRKQETGNRERVWHATCWEKQWKLQAQHGVCAFQLFYFNCKYL